MKRIFVIAIMFLLQFSFCATINAQYRVQGGMITKKVTVKKRHKKQVSAVQAGFQQMASFGYYSEFDNYHHLIIDYIGGYRLNNNFFAGIGLGLDFSAEGAHCEDIRTVQTGWDDYYDNDFYDAGFAMPLYLHARGYVGKKRCQPFVGLSAGTVIRMPGKETTEIRDGGGAYLCRATFKTSTLFMEPMVGVDIRMNSKVSFNTQIGARIQGNPAFEVVDATHAVIKNRSLAHFSIKLGCTF